MSRSRVSQAIEATQRHDYLRALTLFVDFYGSENGPSLDDAKAASGLSFFGLCIALVQKKYKPAIDFCTRAITVQFYNGDHYENLARVYVAAGKRKKALETIELGLKISAEHEGLVALRTELGIRARLPVPFLHRTNPLNVTLGQKRHAKKIAEVESGKKKG